MVKAPNAKRGGLSRFIEAPGSITFDNAVQRGEDAMEFHKHTALAELDRAVCAIGKRLSSAAAPSEDDRRDLMDLANAVATIAGLYHRDCVGATAQALFNLIDELSQHEAWDADAVGVHYGALAMAHARGAIASADEESVLAGLARVRQRALQRAAGVAH